MNTGVVRQDTQVYAETVSETWGDKNGSGSPRIGIAIELVQPLLRDDLGNRER